PRRSGRGADRRSVSRMIAKSGHRLSDEIMLGKSCFRVEGDTAMKVRSINRLALVAALALGWVAFAGPVRAQAPSPGALAAAKELVTLKGGGAMFEPLIPGVIESAKSQFLPTNPNLAGPLNEVATQLHKEYGPKRNELLDIVTKIYAKHFTEAELKDIVAFYKTPA